ncbi:hypothetical protein [Acinetobacter sp. ANC 4173]|uniref:hypothetical protein n=1 Tax=Acinetobacter sp. ANC 4173 TaxID=2529837 RepID=UPI00103EB619|nr:hypothetical protein [Acinetobacter sp. ANC 4173]TCB77727.1 hypothetical protein E0H94_14495 [Acinetobacter sp. ANC 4173]
MSQFPNLTLKNNYILIATSNSKEKDAVRSKLKFKKKFSLTSKIHVYLGILDNLPTIHINGSSGGSTDDSIGKILNYCLLQKILPAPSVIFLVGFCWGNPNLVSLNDTILCTEIESSNQTRFYKDSKEFKSQNIQSTLNSKIFFEPLLNEYIDLKFNKLISFDCYVADTQQRDLLTLSRPEIGGGEMEGWAFISNLNPMPWIIVKSVSDLANDSTNRDEQEKCAQKSANLISIVSKTLITEEAIDITPIQENTDLINLLINHEIKIISSELPSNKYDLNNYLSKNIYPLLEKKLLNYDYIKQDNNLIKHFCILILEMIQNSITHGKSNQVSILFDRNTIKYKDNCIFHDPNTETDNKGGGKTSWKYIKTNYIEKNTISYRYYDEKYQFTFNNIEFLENIPTECIVKYDIPTEPSDLCKNILLDFSTYRMGSLHPLLFIICKKQLLAGKFIYIKINNEIQVMQFQELVFEFPESIKFYY